MLKLLQSVNSYSGNDNLHKHSTAALQCRTMAMSSEKCCVEIMSFYAGEDTDMTGRMYATLLN